jgi:hypothetical protein
VCVRVGNIGATIYLKIKHGTLKVGSYDFPDACDVPPNSHLFFKQPLVSFTCLMYKSCYRESKTKRNTSMHVTGNINRSSVVKPHKYK